MANKLSHIIPADLFGKPSVMVGKTRFEFEELNECLSFQLANDIVLIRTEIERIIKKVQYIDANRTTKLHTAELEKKVAEINSFLASGAQSSLHDLLEILSIEVATSIDMLQPYATRNTVPIINQAKALVILFITKYD